MESTWGYNFTQNGLKLENWWRGILIHTLELKLWHLEVIPICLYRKPCICNVSHPRAMWWAGLRALINVTTFTRFLQNWRLGCLLALYGCTLAVLWGFSGQFFFCLVGWFPWKKKFFVSNFASEQAVKVKPPLVKDQIFNYWSNYCGFID
jgi:hypothetical protein